MLSEEEKKAIELLERIKKGIIADTKAPNINIRNIATEKVQAIDTVLNLVKKQQEQLETIKEYTHQEIVHYTEDIRDYIDDDKEGNKHIIGELKEDREHWKDIEKILQNKPKEELYMNWWRYGLYE